MGVVDMGGGDRDAPRTYGFIVPGSCNWLGASYRWVDAKWFRVRIRVGGCVAQRCEKGRK